MFDKKNNLFACICLCLIIFNMITLRVNAINLVNENKKIILIDPGHGGFDGGAKSKKGNIEKDINLKISLKLKEELVKRGYTVYLTRETDISINKSGKSLREKKVQDLIERCNLKTKYKCNLFISIHQNMYPNEKFSGAQAWYANNDESKLFATILQGLLKEEIDNTNKRLAKPALDKFRILRDDYKAPCIILECGFLSNPNEEEKLINEDYQSKLSNTVSNSIDNYFEKISSWN